MSGGRVLVVGHDEDRRVVLGRLLESHRFEVTVEGNPSAALKRLREGGFRAAVLEIEPGTDRAWDLLTAIRDDRDAAIRELPVVLLSGRNRDVDRLRAWENGCDAWVPRPFHLMELVTAMEDAIARPAGQRDGHRDERLDEERRRIAESRRR